MCYTLETKSSMYVLDTGKCLSVIFVTHEKLIGCLDVLHMNTPTMPIWIAAQTYVTLIKIIPSWL